MITPKQALLLDRLKSDIRTAELIARLQLEPVPSPEFKQAQAVSARVDQLIEAFVKALNLPQGERSVIQEGRWAPGQPPTAVWSPERQFQISSYLESLYSQRPCFPLSSAPF